MPPSRAIRRATGDAGALPGSRLGLGRGRRRVPWRLRQNLPGGQDERDHAADRRVVARVGADGGECAVGRRLELDRDLVGLDLDQRLALAHRLALGGEPANHAAGVLGDAERRHDHVDGHGQPEITVWSPWGRRAAPFASAFRFDCVSRIAGSGPPTVW